VEGAKKFGDKAKVSIDEARIGDKLKTAGNFIAENAVSAGTYVSEKASIAASAIKDKSKEISVTS
jgi:hypothetical protein